MLKRFVTDIVASAYNPVFYTEARRGGYGRPIKLTAALGVIGAALVMSYASFALFTVAFQTDIVSKVEALYPDDLMITLAHGEVSINQPEPYYIKNTLDQGKSGKDMANLVVFDTGDTLKGGANANNTLILVKKTYAIAAGSNGERTTYFSDFATTSTTTLTKASVLHLGDVVRPYVKPFVIIGAGTLVVFGTFFVSLFWLGFHLLYLFIPSLLVYMYGRFRSPHIAWKESYIVALYASIPITIFTFIVHSIGYSWPFLFYTLLVMLVVIVNLAQEPSESPKE